MEEFLFTVIAIYILFRVFGKSNVKVYHFNNYNQPPERPVKRDEGKITIDKKRGGKGPKDDNDGEYIDYEEIK